MSRLNAQLQGLIYLSEEIVALNDAAEQNEWDQAGNIAVKVRQSYNTAVKSGWIPARAATLNELAWFDMEARSHKK